MYHDANGAHTQFELQRTLTHQRLGPIMGRSESMYTHRGVFLFGTEDGHPLEEY